MSTDNMLDIWADATELVRQGLPDVEAVEFEWPGNIDVYIDADTLLTYGPANETINADVSRLVGNMWQPVEHALPDSLVTDVPSDTTDAAAIAGAIVASVTRWQREDVDPELAVPCEHCAHERASHAFFPAANRRLGEPAPLCVGSDCDCEGFEPLPVA